jgi:hypothetical protein
MRCFLNGIFMTLVLLYVPNLLAAKVKQLPPQSEKFQSNENENAPPSREKLETTVITPAPESEKSISPNKILASRKFARKARQVSAGVWGGPLIEIEDIRSSIYAGVSFIEYQNYDFGQELGLEITSEGYLGWQAGYRWIWDMGSRYELYYKTAVGALYNPHENLASFANWKRYHVRGAVGAENLFSNREIRAELAVIWSGIGITYQILGAYAF